MKTQQRKALVKLALLAFGWPLALNHFYDGNAATGVWAIVITWLALATIIGFFFWLPQFLGAIFEELRRFEDDDVVPITHSQIEWSGETQAKVDQSGGDP